MHIDFVLPVEHDLMRGFEEWKVWQGCESCQRCGARHTASAAAQQIREPCAGSSII